MGTVVGVFHLRCATINQVYPLDMYLETLDFHSIRSQKFCCRLTLQTCDFRIVIALFFGQARTQLRSSCSVVRAW
jgi:hypothetical protein